MVYLCIFRLKGIGISSCDVLCKQKHSLWTFVHSMVADFHRPWYLLHCMEAVKGILLWRYFEPVSSLPVPPAWMNFCCWDELQRPRCPWELLVPLSSRLPWPLNVQLTGSRESSQYFMYFELLWYDFISETHTGLTVTWRHRISVCEAGSCCQN